MAVRIRLSSHGRKKRRVFAIVAADARAPRDGRFLEKLGTYTPYESPSHLKINEERALHWLLSGAQPSDTVRNLFSTQGIMLRKHLQMGVQRKKITQVVADARFQAWEKAHGATRRAQVKRIEK